MKLTPALLAMVVTATAAPSDPGESAIRFLEKVRAKNVNLEPGGDTALAPQTGEQKRKEIAGRIERMAGDLGEGDFEVGPVKLDEDLAAVLVRKASGIDPDRLQVFPVALVKRGTAWLAAPVPASYENSGLGYAEELRKRIDVLQEWMRREQIADLERLRGQAEEVVRRKIEKSLPATELAKLNPQQVVNRYLDACAKKRVPEALGLLGGLSKNLPEDWPERVKAVESALGSGHVPRMWRLLSAPEVLRVQVFQQEENDSAELSIACLDPTGNPPKNRNPRVEILSLNLTKTTEGHWRINPPQQFDDEVRDDTDPISEPDARLQDMFPSKLALKYPSTAPDSATKAKDALIASFKNPDPAGWIGLIHATGDPSDARTTIYRAAQTWWETADPSAATRVFPLDFHEKDNLAVAACQFFDAKTPDRMDLKFLFFCKTDAGWIWNPSPSQEMRDSLEKWTSDQAAKASDAWMDRVLRDSVKFDNLPDAAPPSADAARAVVEKWLRAVHSGDVESAIGLTARLSGGNSDATLLRNLGYEITGLRKNKQPPSIIDARSGGVWVGVGVKAITDGKPAFTFYPVLNTPFGPRILLEIDLLAPDSRSRDFLNKSSLSRLRAASAQAAEELGKLFADYQATVKTPPAP